MNLRRWLPIYAPLLFLAAISFWLSPPDINPSPPDYTVALQSVQYSRPQPDGALQLVAKRIEYAEDGARLFNVQLSHMQNDNKTVLAGVRGTAHRNHLHQQIALQQVRGTIKNGAQLLTLHADSIVYDTAGEFSGQQAHIVGNGGHLRGDTFLWNADGGLKLEGNVESVYVAQ